MFVWSESKRRKVLKDHNIDFNLVSDVFEDSFSIDFIDEAHSTESETRYAVIGKTAQYGLIELIYTIAENEDIRFITARRAEHWMVREYEKRRNRI